MRPSIALLSAALFCACRPPGRIVPIETARPPQPSIPKVDPDRPAKLEPAVAVVPPAATIPQAADPVVSKPSGTGKRAAFLSEVNARLRDAYFDYDRAAVRPDAEEALRFDHQLLRGLLADFPDLVVIVEGHCDERGSAEYNLALGDRRAASAIEFLQSLGLAAENFRPVSYGKEKPQCVEDSESCRQRNRRAHLVALDGQ